MNKHLNSSFHELRLIRLLTDIGLPGMGNTHAYFAEKIGQLVGFSGSITLSRLHDDFPEISDAQADNVPVSVCRKVKDEFIQFRSKILEHIALSFVPEEKGLKDRLPTANELYTHYQVAGVFSAGFPKTKKIQAAAFEPYRKFYVARQKELEYQTHRLRSHVEKSIAALSPELAQLSKFDAAFNTILSSQTRSLLDGVPKILGKHFSTLFDTNQKTLPLKPKSSDIEKWMQPENWLFLFCKKLKEFLLAELEMRLQPTIGMIDAVSEKQAVN